MSKLPKSPYPGKPGIDSKEVYEACSNGELEIFSGEKPTPASLPDRLSVIPGRNFSVDPETLIDVAKHIADPITPSQRIVEKAYEIICEAHLLSRNLAHWNEKAENHHLDPAIKKITDAHAKEIEKGIFHCPRKAVLVAFEKHLGNEVSESTASENFNEWIRESTRTDEFLEAIHYNHHDSQHDRHLFNMLITSGWIECLSMGSRVEYYPPRPISPAIPLIESPPTLRSDFRSKATVLCLETEPYWNSEDRWWPNPDKETLEAKKREILTANGQFFLSPFIAARTLEKYAFWREAWAERKRRHQKPPATPRKDSETGHFIRKKPAQDPDTGKFRKK